MSILQSTHLPADRLMVPDLFDTSRIPDEPPYWDALAERVSARAAAASQAGADPIATPWLDRFSRSPIGWAAAVVLLATGLVMSRADGAGEGDDATLRAAWTTALAPADDVGSALSRVDAPPSLVALLLGDPVAGAR
jgi:hypothetical protein